MLNDLDFDLDLDFDIHFMQQVEIEIVIQIEIVKQSRLLCIVFYSSYEVLSWEPIECHEKEGDIGMLALITDADYPFWIHGAGAGSGFSADNGPVYTFEGDTTNGTE